MSIVCAPERGYTFVRDARNLPRWSFFGSVENGGDSELLFTLFQTAGMSDERFEADASQVETDLAALKAALEAPGDASAGSPEDP